MPHQVIGIVTGRNQDHYHLNIFASRPAILSTVGFEGATKRNKPNLKVGEVVYCRVVDWGVCEGMEGDVIVTCIEGNSSGGTTGKKDWMTSECIYGELKDGVTFVVPLFYALELLRPKNVCLNELGMMIPFEIAVGMNGLIWVKCGSRGGLECVWECVLWSVGKSDGEVKGFVKGRVRDWRKEEEREKEKEDERKM